MTACREEELQRVRKDVKEETKVSSLALKRSASFKCYECYANLGPKALDNGYSSTIRHIVNRVLK